MLVFVPGKTVRMLWLSTNFKFPKLSTRANGVSLFIAVSKSTACVSVRSIKHHNDSEILDSILLEINIYYTCTA